MKHKQIAANGLIPMYSLMPQITHNMIWRLYENMEYLEIVTDIKNYIYMLIVTPSRH